MSTIEITIESGKYQGSRRWGRAYAEVVIGGYWEPIWKLGKPTSTMQLDETAFGGSSNRGGKREVWGLAPGTSLRYITKGSDGDNQTYSFTVVPTAEPMTQVVHPLGCPEMQISGTLRPARTGK